MHNPRRAPGEGLGLGLAIVTRLASLLGAEIDVASKIGRGSRFSLALPIIHDAAPLAADLPSPEDRGGRVLIIEDNVYVSHGLEVMLTEWGYQALAAQNGEDALDLAAQQGWRFDIIVADHRLGAGLTGVESAKRIGRRAGHAVPTVVLTGDTAVERIAEIEASGFELLHKPVAAEELRHKLARLIER